MKKEVLEKTKDFFDMVVSGKTDYDQMALSSLGVNKKIKNQNCSTSLN